MGAFLTRFEYEDDYESIRVEDDPSTQRRMLVFEDGIQGIISLEAPHEPVLEYISQACTVWQRWFARRKPQQLLLGGVGAGAVNHAAGKMFPELEQTSVDVNERVLELVRKWFMLPQQVNLVHEDFRLALLDYSQIDILFVDCYTAIAIPPPLMTAEFKTMVRDALSKNGLALFNLWDGQEHELFFSQLKTLIEVFGKVALWPCESDGNILAVVSKCDITELADAKIRVFDHHQAEITFEAYTEAEVIRDDNLSYVLDNFGIGL